MSCFSNVFDHRIPSFILSRSVSFNFSGAHYKCLHQIVGSLRAGLCIFTLEISSRLCAD